LRCLNFPFLERKKQHNNSWIHIMQERYIRRRVIVADQNIYAIILDWLDSRGSIIIGSLHIQIFPFIFLCFKEHEKKIPILMQTCRHQQHLFMLQHNSSSTFFFEFLIQWEKFAAIFVKFLFLQHKHEALIAK